MCKFITRWFPYRIFLLTFEIYMLEKFLTNKLSLKENLQTFKNLFAKFQPDCLRQRNVITRNQITQRKLLEVLNKWSFLEQDRISTKRVFIKENGGCSKTDLLSSKSSLRIFQGERLFWYRRVSFDEGELKLGSEMGFPLDWSYWYPTSVKWLTKIFSELKGRWVFS